MSDEAPLVADCQPHVRRRHLRLAHEEEVTSFGGSAVSSGVLMTSPGRAGRTSLGVTMMARSVSFFWNGSWERAPRTGNIAKPWQLLDGVLVNALQQAADDETLAVAQFDRGRGAADDQRRHSIPGDHDQMAEIELTDFGFDFQVDQPAA